jgi:hypothetical protein
MKKAKNKLRKKEDLLYTEIYLNQKERKKLKKIKKKKGKLKFRNILKNKKLNKAKNEF